jgi:hypothetical protein
MPTLVRAHQVSANNGLGWLPLLVLVSLALWFSRTWQPWACMWALLLAVFVGLKWLTWWHDRLTVRHSAASTVAYLLAWPGMDARAFFSRGNVRKPKPMDWFFAFCKVALGIVLMWGCVRQIPASHPFFRGWLGIIAFMLILHFGLLEAIALAWQSAGVRVEAIMQLPLFSESLSEFWGKRWNNAFRHLSHEFIFQPLCRRIGAHWALLLVFLFSGLLHDLTISIPARAGYGLPTAYFVLQGAAILLERSRLGRSLRLDHGFTGWAYMTLIAGGPVYWLFHPPFMHVVALPFMHAIRAL